jgi:hypothetical protein
MVQARLAMFVLVILQINISEEKNSVRVVIEKMRFLISVDHGYFAGFVRFFNVMFRRFIGKIYLFNLSTMSKSRF